MHFALRVNGNKIPETDDGKTICHSSYSAWPTKDQSKSLLQCTATLYRDAHLQALGGCPPLLTTSFQSSGGLPKRNKHCLCRTLTITVSLSHQQSSASHVTKMLPFYHLTKIQVTLVAMKWQHRFAERLPLCRQVRTTDSDLLIRLRRGWHVASRPAFTVFLLRVKDTVDRQDPFCYT